MAISKVVYGGDTLLDLTADTVTADKLLSGTKAHGADGEPLVGTCTFDADTQDATATAAEILATRTAYNKGHKVEGIMPNNGSVVGAIATKDGQYTVPQGYHDGGGKVGIDATEKAKLIPENIRDGIMVLGVEGTMSGTEGAKPQSKTVVPSISAQTVLPDANAGYNYLSQVVVSAIPYSESQNSAGGVTATIG